MNDDDLVFCLWSSKTKTFTATFELLHELINEGNLECSEKGIRLINVNSNGDLVVYLELKSENFEKYFCKESINLGINLDHIYKIIKLVENNETLKLYVTNSDRNKLCVERFNKEESIVSTKSLSLYDIDILDIPFPTLSFNNVIIMPSQRFKKLCQEFYSFSDTVEIISNNNTLFFKSEGDAVDQNTSICESEDGIVFEKKNSDNDIFRGLYKLKYLSKFSKCSNLCTNININFKNDLPLVLECRIDDFGLIRLCISEMLEDS